jgi:glycosyltransferase involved in cell wall biosynthesis
MLIENLELGLGRTKTLVFWEPTASPHKMEFFSSLAMTLPMIEVVVIADRSVSEERRALGWQSADVTAYTLVLNPDKNQVEDLVRESNKNCLHVLSGFRNVKTNVWAMRAVKKYKRRFALMQEPRSSEGIAGLLRFVQSWMTERWIRSNVEVVLAIGANGPRWFKRTGYKPDKVFPFAYFVMPKIAQNQQRSESGVSVGFLGRIVREKGVFDLIRACAMLPFRYELSIAGVGNDLGRVEQLAKSLGVAYKYHGVVKMNDVGDYLASLDVLVLASLTDKDGWGVVVSEALMAGVAVVVSGKVGASLAVVDPALGEVVDHGASGQIASSIGRLKDMRSNSSRELRQRWAVSALSADAGSRYFAKILGWLESECLSERPQCFCNGNVRSRG